MRYKLQAFTAWPVFALMIGIGGPTLAQSQPSAQTPENAHKFMIDLSSMSEIMLTPPDNVEYREAYSERFYTDPYCRKKQCEEPVRRDSEAPGPSYPLKILSSSQCSTKLGSKPDLQRREEQKSQFASFPNTVILRPFKDHIDVLYDVGIDWSSVQRVSTNEGTSSIVVQMASLNGKAFTLTFKSSDMALRAAYALEVIRQSCDPLAGSAF